MNQILDPGKLMKAAPTVQPVLPVLTPDMLRDWFACSALIGICGDLENHPDTVAEAAYEFADAMMAARVKE